MGSSAKRSASRRPRVSTTSAAGEVYVVYVRSIVQLDHRHSVVTIAQPIPVLPVDQRRVIIEPAVTYNYLGSGMFVSGDIEWVEGEAILSDAYQAVPEPSFD